MIQVLYGERGSGKTERMIEMANKAAQEARGQVLFVSRDNRNIYNVNHSVRYVDASEYSATQPEYFMGFLSGLLAGNFDIEKVFLLGFPKLGGFGSAEGMKDVMAEIEQMSASHNVDFIMSIRGDAATVPDFIKPSILN